MVDSSLEKSLGDLCLRAACFEEGSELWKKEWYGEIEIRWI